MARLQSDLDRLQAALDRVRLKDIEGKSFGSLYCGTLNGWSVGIKVEENSDKPVGQFLLEGIKSTVRLDPEFLAVLADYEATGAVGDKILELKAKSL